MSARETARPVIELPLNRLVLGAAVGLMALQVALPTIRFNLISLIANDALVGLGIGINLLSHLAIMRCGNLLKRPAWMLAAALCWLYVTLYDTAFMTSPAVAAYGLLWWLVLMQALQVVRQWQSQHTISPSFSPSYSLSWSFGRDIGLLGCIVILLMAYSGYILALPPDAAISAGEIVWHSLRAALPFVDFLIALSPLALSMMLSVWLAGLGLMQVIYLQLMPRTYPAARLWLYGLAMFVPFIALGIFSMVYGAYLNGLTGIVNGQQAPLLVTIIAGYGLFIDRFVWALRIPGKRAQWLTRFVLVSLLVCNVVPVLCAG